MMMTVDDYEHVDEKELRARVDSRKDPALIEILKVADEWRAAGCTPVFIVANDDPKVIACVSRETFGRDYN